MCQVIDLKMLIPGLSKIVQKKISEADTAQNYGGGMLGQLLATPAYVDLMITAAVQTVDPLLPKGFITVGHYMSFTHNVPTGLGMTVSIKAVLSKVNGNRLFFDIVAYDEAGEIGRGQHERVVVNREHLLAKVKERAEFLNKQLLK